jgi:hypothetical protein
MRYDAWSSAASTVPSPKAKVLLQRSGQSSGSIHPEVRGGSVLTPAELLLFLA